jgi:choline dehydrogenase-like flavoprotein
MVFLFLCRVTNAQKEKEKKKTDQSIQLSGIGDQDQLSQHGIESIVPLPGVGTNLQGESSAPS